MESVNSPDANIFAEQSTDFIYGINNEIWIWRLFVVILIVALYLFIERLCSNITFDYNKNSHHDLFRHLSYVDNILIKYKIKYWITHTTLLGAIRLNRFIKSSSKFEIGVFIDDHDKLIGLNNIIKKDGYSIDEKTFTYGINIKTNKEELIWCVSAKLSYNNKQVGNIYFYKKFNDGFIRRYQSYPKEHININYEPSMNTFPSWFVDITNTNVLINNKKFASPRDPWILLEYLYGTTWKTMKINDENNESEKDYSKNKINEKRYLSFLINYVHKKTNKILVPTQNMATVTFSQSQIEWMKNNDPILK